MPGPSGSCPTFATTATDFPAAGELIQKMSRLFGRVVRPMQESSRKEISLSRMKSQRSSMDYRVAEAPAPWDSYLEDGE